MLTPADTAYSIAVVRAAERDRPESERLFDDPYAATFAAAGAHAQEGTQRFLDLPFFTDGIRLRTRFIDDMVREGLAAGLRQVVLLGAGFDSRALRMPEIPAHGARVFEVDLPAQFEIKRRVLASSGTALADRVAYVPCDFSSATFDVALATDLAQAGFRRGAGAIVVWEGVIGYIDDAAIERTLRFVVDVCGRGSRLVFTYGANSFYPQTPEDRTRRAGFASCDDFGFDELWRRYLPGPPHEYASTTHAGVAIV